MADLPADKNYARELNRTSSSTWTTSAVVFLSSLNAFLSIAALLGNVLILFALKRQSSLHPPTKLSLQNLAASDIGVGLFSQPIFVIAVMARVTKMNRDVLDYLLKWFYISSYTFCAVSVMISSAISVDRLLALSLRSRYRQVVSVRRVRTVMFSFWLIGVLCGLLSLSTYRISKIAVIIVAFISVVISIFCYMKIYATLRQNQAQVQDHSQQGQPTGEGIPLNITRYKRTVSRILWVQLALVACYIPFCFVSILRLRGMTIEIVWLSSATLVYFNSSLNPILYCWKIREVRQAVKDILSQFYSFCSQILG